MSPALCASSHKRDEINFHLIISYIFVCVTGAVIRSHGQETKVHEIEECMKSWFHNISDKEGGRKRRDRARQILWQQFEREAAAAAAEGRPLTPYSQASSQQSTSSSNPSQTVTAAISSALTELY